MDDERVRSPRGSHLKATGYPRACDCDANGPVKAFIITVPAAIGVVRDGRLKALGVTSKARVDVLPDVPAIAEALPGFEATAWDGFCGPRGTPPDIVDKLNSEINAVSPIRR